MSQRSDVYKGKHTNTGWWRGSSNVKEIEIKLTRTRTTGSREIKVAQRSLAPELENGSTNFLCKNISLQFLQ